MSFEEISKSSKSKVIDFLSINKSIFPVFSKSKILSLLLMAFPPACSAMNASGEHSYSNRSFPLGALVVSGYK